MAMIYAAPRTERLTAWLSRNGGTIVLALPGSRELRFQDPDPGLAAGSNWDVLDQILRSTGK
jgi:hypothetical protein